MHVTLAQVEPRPRDLSANLERVREMLAASAATDLVVLPELFLSGYQLADVEPLAADLDGPEIGALRAAARNASTGLVTGLAERVAAGVANSAICIDSDGEVAGVYRKTHLFGDERDVYVAGDSLSPIKLGARTLGVMICFDMEFPEVARTLANQGADLLVTISANSPPFALDHDLFARTRALENGLGHVYVNRVGEEDGLSFCGGSLALDPDASVLAAAEAGEQVVSAELGEPGRRDPRTRYRDLTRDELYLQRVAGI